MEYLAEILNLGEAWALIIHIYIEYPRYYQYKLRTQFFVKNNITIKIIDIFLICMGGWAYSIVYIIYDVDYENNI